jgi:hypothetical protein
VKIGELDVVAVDEEQAADAGAGERIGLMGAGRAMSSNSIVATVAV